MSDITLSFQDLALDAGKGPAKLVTFVGQLDETNIEEQAKKLYAVLESEKPKHLVFDFTGLTYLNSKSIGYITDWQSKITGNGGKLVIYGAADTIFDILDVVGLTKIIELVKTQEEAKNLL